MSGSGRVRIAGAEFDPLTHAEVIEAVAIGIRAASGGTIVTPNIDICHRIRKDPDSRAYVASASLVVPDGMPLLWAARLAGQPLPERITGAAICVGVGRRALAVAAEYARNREVWGVPIGTHQGVSHTLAKAKIAVDLAALMTAKAAWLHDHGQPAGEASNMAKYAAAEAAPGQFRQVHAVAAADVNDHVRRGGRGQVEHPRRQVDTRVLVGVDRLARRQVRIVLVLGTAQEIAVRPGTGQLAEPGEPPATS